MRNHLTVHEQMFVIIKERLRELDMTQAQLGRYMGWAPDYVPQVLSRKQTTTIKNLEKMLRILDIRLKVVRVLPREEKKDDG